MGEVAFAPHAASPFYASASAMDTLLPYDEQPKESETTLPLDQGLFSFPARPAPKTRAPASEPRSRIRRPPPLLQNSSEATSRSHTRGINSTGSLPAFRFNPGAPKEMRPQAVEVPHQPAVSAPTTPARAGRHRRTASEFIGGGGPHGALNIRTGSPDKHWVGTSAQPAISAFGSLPSRLEHRHRRGDSSSSRMAVPDGFNSFNLSMAQLNSIAEPALDSREEPPDEPRVSITIPTRRRESASAAVPLPTLPRSPRARVGFSDTLEYIPRPLSTISSDSGSSISTIRGHSISGSISSVLHTAAGSPLSKLANSPLKAMDLQGQSPLRPRSTSPLHVVGSHNSFIPFDREGAPQRPTSAGASLDCTKTTSNSAEDIPIPLTPLVTTNIDDAHRPRRLGPWATFRGRRSKSSSEPGQSPLGVSQPSPTLDNVFSASELNSVSPFELSENFDEDPTSVIVLSNSPHLGFPSTSTPPLTPIESSHNTAPSSMIDLDAAFGPFDDSSPGRDARDATGRKIDSRRSMHSSTTTSGFFATGLHRRSDSAPSHIPVNLDPIQSREYNNSTSSFKRFQMEDVFEEDEDNQNALPPSSSTQSNTGGEGLGIGKEHSGRISLDEGPSTRSTSADSAARSIYASRRTRRSNFAISTLPSNDIFGSASAPESANLEQHETLHSRNAYLSNTFITFSNTPEPQSSQGQNAQSSEVSTSMRPALNPDTRFAPSPLSFTNCACEEDCVHQPRRNTSISLGLDSRRPYGHVFGEPGPDMRHSVDDVPSLISSRSTNTNAAHVRAPSTSSRGFAPRSVSSSLSLNSGMERRRKRSSIASFLGGSFGEKQLQPLEPGKRWQTPVAAKDIKSPTKSSRISRLFRFWKSKEAAI